MLQALYRKRKQRRRGFYVKIMKYRLFSLKRPADLQVPVDFLFRPAALQAFFNFYIGLRDLRVSAQFRDVDCKPCERSFLLKRKFRVGIVGATGYVGQRLVALLEDHPWFELGALAAGIHSADKTYAEAVEGRWKLPVPIPANARDLRIFPSEKLHEFCEELDFAFCAVDMEKEELITLERSLALEEIPVISNNSAMC